MCISFLACFLFQACAIALIEKQSLDARVDELNTAGNPALAIKSVWSRDPKVIDGSISSPEWYVARNHTTFPAPNTGTFWAENDQMYMYLGLNIQDRDLPDINTIAFVFDTGNDGAFATGGEPMFQYMPAQQLLVYASITSFMGMGTMQELPDGCAAVSAQSGDDTRFEMQVPLSVLDTAPGGYVGIFMMYMLNTGGTPNFYPANPFDIGAWPAIQLSMPDMGSPLLADETFLPAAPPYYTNMSYTFSVNYSDPDNNAPNAISVVIDGESVRLDQENLLDTDYMDGAIFSCDVALGAGTHEYYFQTIQGLNDIRLPGTSNLTTPFITHVNNKAPTLSGSGVNLPSGDNFTVFIFTTTYKDEDNNAPVEVNVNIDGIPHPMEPLVQSSGPTNYIAGVTYAHETQLGAGSHEYYFSCNDGTFAARDPPATNYTGPAVIAGSPSALFDGLYLTASIPFGLLGTFTQMRYDYELLPNGTYAGGVWGYFVDWMLVETFNEDPDTGMVSSVVYYTGGPGGGPMVNGMRDPVWIQKNATLGSSYFLALGGAPVLWTVTGESWCTYGVHNRSCWVLTDGSGSYALYDKQTGVVLEMYVITSTPPVTSEVLDTNALDFHAPAISSVIISPSSGDGTTLFTFGALVKDLDGIGPKGVDLVLDGVSFPMQPATGYPGVEDWVNGVNHTLSMYLESGMHEYHVLASGSRYSARYPPSSNLTISVYLDALEEISEVPSSSLRIRLNMGSGDITEKDIVLAKKSVSMRDDA